MSRSRTTNVIDARIDILLAAYNGEQFLSEQFESILNQDYTHRRLIVRDDGSSDGTMAIVREFAQRFPEKISLLDDSKGNLGRVENFLQLLAASTADYVMFSDQDDVWLPDKISTTMEMMRVSEEKYGKFTPILIHTDLRVTDGNLSVISDSFWKYQKISPACSSINRLLVQNVVTGCTVMINRSLMNLVHPVSVGVIEHDWWLALIAASFGKIVFVPKQTILYRQHGKNAVGAMKWEIRGMARKFYVEKNRFVAGLEKTRCQAALFLKSYQNILPLDVAREISIYARLHELSVFARLYYVVRYGFLKIGVLRNIGMFFILLSI